MPPQLKIYNYIHHNSILYHNSPATFGHFVNFLSTNSLCDFLKGIPFGISKRNGFQSGQVPFV